MAPIRVGLIGLASTPADQYEGTNWAASAHLPYLTKSPHYEITALLNSTIDSAKASIKKHNLPPSVKAYGNPEGKLLPETHLAADPDIDMVVCCTRVDRHLSTVRPSILASKTIFVEWPLEKNVLLARELSTLAKTHHAKTLVGIQGAFSSPVRKIKEMVDGGTIGKVLGSTVFSALGNSGKTESQNVRYFLDREVGGNTISIHFGHAMECFIYVLGEFKTHTSYLVNQHPTKNILSASGAIIQTAAPNTVPDQHLFQGITTRNIPFSMHRRGGPPFPGTPALEWRIQGDLGEIRLTSSDYFLPMGHPAPVTRIELYLEGRDGKEGIVEEVSWGSVRDGVDEMDLPVLSRSIAREYEAFRRGDWVPDFEWAVKRQEMIEGMWGAYDESVRRGLQKS